MGLQVFQRVLLYFHFVLLKFHAMLHKFPSVMHKFVYLLLEWETFLGGRVLHLLAILYDFLAFILLRVYNFSLRGGDNHLDILAWSGRRAL